MSTPQDTNLPPYPFITIDPTKPHTATVIWLHGLGGSGKSMYYPATTLVKSISGLEHVKFIFPTAHVMRVTGSGSIMNSWFDVDSFDYEMRKDNERGLINVSLLIDNIIAQEEREHAISPHRIVIGGISQGSATALYTALTSARPLAGAFVLAGYVALRHKIKEVMTPHGPSLPIFWGHGRDDERLKIKFSRSTAVILASDLGVPFNGYTGRLGSSDPESEPGIESNASSSEPTTAEAALSDSDESIGSIEADPLPPPMNTSLAEALGVDALREPGVRFVTYADLGHWMNEAMLQDLGVWIRALLP
ncbi:hypothetical protein C0991_006754 [Blastosporella zonata]|nr:hypothetical protein C0991_006754 [Blastosporella zonata]